MKKAPKSSSFLGDDVRTSLFVMTAKSNNNKKPSSKKPSNKKAVAKKGSPKKKPVANTKKESTRTEVQEKLEGIVAKFAEKTQGIKTSIK